MSDSDDEERPSFDFSLGRRGSGSGSGSSDDGEVISETTLLKLSADADNDAESSPKFSDPFDNPEGVRNPFSSIDEDDIRHPWLQDEDEKKPSIPNISKIPVHPTVDEDKKDEADEGPALKDTTSKEPLDKSSDQALNSTIGLDVSTPEVENDAALSNIIENVDTDSKNVDTDSKNVDTDSKNVDIDSKNVDTDSKNVDTNSKNVDTDSNEGDVTNSAASPHEEAEPDSTVPISITKSGKIKTGSKDNEEENWKEDLRAAIRESQQSIIGLPLPLRPDEDKYYKITVKVPRVTKSYYDDLRGRDEKGEGKETARMGTKSDSALNQKHGHGGPHGATQDYDPCVPPPKKRGMEPKLAPTQAKLSLAPVKAKHGQDPPATATHSRGIVPTRAASHSQTGSRSDFNLPHPSQSRHMVGHEEEILSYFDPEMVQPAYKQLLEKSRNIVIGPPKEILRQYFGYTRNDPMPLELRNDNSPKAFILPRNLWKDFDDVTKKKEDATKERRFSQISLGSLDQGDSRPMASLVATSKPTRSITAAAAMNLKKKKKGNDVLSSETQQKQLLNPTTNPLDFFKQSAMKTNTADTGDPRSYERIRTKCERKKRRENSFDEDVRDRESEYKVVCGSGSSSATLSIGGSGGFLENPKSGVSTSTKDKDKDKDPSKLPSTKPSEIPKEVPKRSSLFNYIDRDPSDLVIELGPDPMQRLPREPSEFKYYKSYPMYPTFSNETFYDWYKDLNRLQPPVAPHSRKTQSLGILKNHDDPTRQQRVCIPQTPTSHSFVSKRTPTPSGYLGTHERPDEDARDYVYDNARLISIMPPKIPVPRYVDDRNGTTHLLEPSGLLHKYVHRDDFGKMPNYLMFRNEELGRPAYPNFNKFYSFHRCKYKHGHIHCKCCNRVYPTRGGEGDWECDMLNEDEFGEYSGDVKVNASHSHSRLEDSYSGQYKHFHPTDHHGQSMWSLGKDTQKSHSSGLSKGIGFDANGDPVSHMVSRISQLLSKQEDASNQSQSRTAAHDHYRNPNYDPSSTTNQFSSGTGVQDPTSMSTYCPTGFTSASGLDPTSTSAFSSTTNYSNPNFCPSGTTQGHPSVSQAGQSGQNLYVVSTHPNSLHKLEGSLTNTALSGSTGSFTFHPVSSKHS